MSSSNQKAPAVDRNLKTMAAHDQGDVVARQDQIFPEDEELPWKLQAESGGNRSQCLFCTDSVPEHDQKMLDAPKSGNTVAKRDNAVEDNSNSMSNNEEYSSSAKLDTVEPDTPSSVNGLSAPGDNDLNACKNIASILERALRPQITPEELSNCKGVKALFQMDHPFTLKDCELMFVELKSCYEPFPIKETLPDMDAKLVVRVRELMHNEGMLEELERVPEPALLSFLQILKYPFLEPHFDEVNCLRKKLNMVRDTLEKNRRRLRIVPSKHFDEDVRKLAEDVGKALDPLMKRLDEHDRKLLGNVEKALDSSMRRVYEHANKLTERYEVMAKDGTFKKLAEDAATVEGRETLKKTLRQFMDEDVEQTAHCQKEVLEQLEEIQKMIDMHLAE